MATFRLAAALLVALAVCAPALAAPAEGRLEAAGPLSLPRGANLTAEGVTLAWSGDGAPALDLRAAHVRVERYGHREAAVPLAGVTSNSIDETAEHGAATVRIVAGEGAQELALSAPAARRAVLAAAELRPVEAVRVASLADAADARACTGRGCIALRGVYEALGAGSMDVAGDVTLVLRGPTLVVDDGQERAYASGASREPGPAGATEETIVVVHLARAAGRVEAAAGARWYAAAPLVETPAAAFADATGALEVGERRYRAAGEPVEAAGALRLATEPVKPAAQLPAGADPRAPDYADAFAAAIAGDVSSISLRAVPVYAEDPAVAAGALLGLAAVAAAVAWLWPAIQYHGTVALLPLYSRLNKPGILDNDVRNAIYEIIRQNPGISARAIHRESQQSWGTVVYHLRQLERHHVVVSRALGRTRNYYENHGKYRGMEAQLACLQSDRARALAHLVLGRPGSTQEEIVAVSGFPQPTTSYYIRKLKDAGLVSEQREGRYVRYQPSADLPRYLAIADAPAAAAPA